MTSEATGDGARTLERAGPLRFGIVGCGGAAVDFADGVGRGSTATISAVHDTDPERARDLAASSGARVHRRLADLLADSEVDAVYVALPHDLLAPTARTALRAGRHALVEKPVATTLAGLDGVRAAAAHANRSVGVMFELRFTDAATRAAELVRAGAIGEVRVVRIRTLIDKPASYWRSGPTGRVVDSWRASRRRAGGGVVLMNAIHQLDVLRAVTGLRVVEVAAQLATWVPDVEVEEAASVALRFDNGALGALVANAHAAGAERAEEIEIDGSDGAIRIPDPYGPPLPLRLHLRRPWRDHPAGRWIEVATVPRDPWSAAIDAFALAVTEQRPPQPGLDDAEAALATVVAIYRSARRGLVERVRPAPPSPEPGSSDGGGDHG